MVNPLTDRWPCYFKVILRGSYWRVAWALNFAKLMGVKIEYFSAGTMNGERQ